MTKADRQKIDAILKRWDVWQRIYPADYIRRHFYPFDGELEALIRMAQGRKQRRKEARDGA